MNILFLSHRIPFPPNKGDKIRSYNIIKYLSKEHNIYLGTIIDCENDKKHCSHLKSICKEVRVFNFNKKIRLLKSIINGKPFSISSFYYKGLQKYVDHVLKNFKINAIICFSSSMAEYIFRTPLYQSNKLKNIKLIIDYIDLDSDKWLQYANYSKFPLSSIYREEKKRLLKYEIMINQTFHHSLFVCKRELDVFKKQYVDVNKVTIVSNGVDIEYFTPKKYQPDNKNPRLLFTGVMDYFANVDGVKWFCDKIFNKIKAKFPNVEFYIVGTSPIKSIRDLATRDGIKVTGFVSDIRDYYWKADVCVIPLRIARGLQNKVLEAMATGNAVIATSNAKNGINCRENTDIIITDKEEDFSNEVITLLNDPEKRRILGENAIENIRKNYLWEKNLKMLDDLLR